MPSLKQIPNALTVSRFGLAIAFPMVPPAYHTAIILTALATEFLRGSPDQFSKGGATDVRHGKDGLWIDA